MDDFRRDILAPAKDVLSDLDMPFSLAYVESIEHSLGLENPTMTRFSIYAETLQERIVDELKMELLLQIPREKTRFYRYAERMSPRVEEAFPSAVGELSAAGRCLSYGEPTSAVFHLLRVVDKGLRLVADSISFQYENSNWGGIAKPIRELIHDNAKDHSAAWAVKERFYSTVLADITGIGKAHRNPVLHQLEEKYTDGEAEHLFVLVEGFMLHLAENGIAEKP
jgi:hypothetical protein